MSPGGAQLEGDGRPRQLDDGRGCKMNGPAPSQEKSAFPRSLMSQGKTPTPERVRKALHCTTDENLKFKCTKESER